MESLGEALVCLRERRRTSLSEVARRAGVGKATLSRWERGLALPLVPELRAVLGALGVPEERQDEIVALVDAPRARRALGGSAHGQLRPDLLAALRGRVGFDQSQLARRLGVSQATVARWESGGIEPSPETLDRIVGALGGTPDEREALASRTPLDLADDTDGLERRFLRAWYDAPRPKDLEILALREALRDRRDSAELAARVAIRHAQYLGECERTRETVVAARQALDLAEAAGFEVGRLVPAILAEAAQTRSPTRALRVMRPLDERVQGAETLAWIADERGYHLARAGILDAAVASARRGIELARGESVEEAYFRHRGAARTFVRAGLLDAAQDAIAFPRPESLRESSEDHRVRAEVAAAVGNVAMAAVHRERAVETAASEGRLLRL